MIRNTDLLQWVYYSDDQLYATRWDTIISNRDKLDLVEINTWNDYGESHYVGPIKGAQPNSQAWVDGYEHTGEFILCFVAPHTERSGQDSLT